MTTANTIHLMMVQAYGGYVSSETVDGTMFNGASVTGDRGFLFSSVFMMVSKTLRGVISEVLLNCSVRVGLSTWEPLFQQYFPRG